MQPRVLARAGALNHAVFKTTWEPAYTAEASGAQAAGSHQGPPLLWPGGFGTELQAPSLDSRSCFVLPKGSNTLHTQRWGTHGHLPSRGLDSAAQTLRHMHSSANPLWPEAKEELGFLPFRRRGLHTCGFPTARLDTGWKRCFAIEKLQSLTVPPPHLPTQQLLSMKLDSSPINSDAKSSSNWCSPARLNVPTAKELSQNCFAVFCAASQ